MLQRAASDTASQSHLSKAIEYIYRLATSNSRIRKRAMLKLVSKLTIKCLLLSTFCKEGPCLSRRGKIFLFGQQNKNKIEDYLKFQIIEDELLENQAEIFDLIFGKDINIGIERLEKNVLFYYQPLEEFVDNPVPKNMKKFDKVMLKAFKFGEDIDLIPDPDKFLIWIEFKVQKITKGKILILEFEEYLKSTKMPHKKNEGKYDKVKIRSKSTDVVKNKKNLFRISITRNLSKNHKRPFYRSREKNVSKKSQSFWLKKKSRPKSKKVQMQRGLEVEINNMKMKKEDNFRKFYVPLEFGQKILKKKKLQQESVMQNSDLIWRTRNGGSLLREQDKQDVIEFFWGKKSAKTENFLFKSNFGKNRMLLNNRRHNLLSSISYFR